MSDIVVFKLQKNRYLFLETGLKSTHGAHVFEKKKELILEMSSFLFGC